MKRSLDVILSSFALIVVAPILSVIAAAIAISSPGPIFYRGVRVGRGGRLFRIWKFRTMVPDAEKRGGSATANDDVRVTRIGRLLRRYKLDELPQFINVMAGDMSLVGPRPEVQKYTDMYSVDEQRILDVRPGITDWASIWDADEGSVLAGHADAELAYEHLIRPTKLRLQLYYIDTCSTATDLRILFYTLWRLLRPTWLPAEVKVIAGVETFNDHSAPQLSRTFEL